MPYIEQDKRREVDECINSLARVIQDDGMLNYVITRLVSRYLAPDATWRYHLVARAVGALECVKQEFYRRVAEPYEDRCIAKNGDVIEYNEADHHNY